MSDTGAAGGDASHHGDEHVEGLEQPAQGRSCLFWGCLTGIVLALVLAIGAGACIYKVYSSFSEHTAEEPMEIPVYEPREGEFERLEERYGAFIAAAGRGEEAELALTADDLNAQLAANPDPEVRALARHVHFDVEDDRLVIQTSVPLGETPLGERYFNGRVVTDLAIGPDGRLELLIESIETFPGGEMDRIEVGALKSWLASPEARNKPLETARDALAAGLGEAESIDIEGDRVVLRSRASPEAPRGQ